MGLTPEQKEEFREAGKNYRILRTAINQQITEHQDEISKLEKKLKHYREPHKVDRYVSVAMSAAWHMPAGPLKAG
jgi:predicted DNA-binding protein YlxM (UPF0122 family)